MIHIYKKKMNLRLLISPVGTVITLTNCLSKLRLIPTNCTLNIREMLWLNFMLRLLIQEIPNVPKLRNLNKHSKKIQITLLTTICVTDKKLCQIIENESGPTKDASSMKKGNPRKAQMAVGCFLNLSNWQSSEHCTWPTITELTKWPKLWKLLVGWWF